jgi:hypothetical protein
MKIKKEQIVGIVGVLGIAYYVFFCKKKPTGASATEEPSSGGGGGGGFGGGGFAPPTGLVVLQTPAVPTTPATPRPASQGRSYKADEITTIKNTTPTAASTSSTSVGAQSGVGVTNTGGIKGIGAGTSTGTGGFIPSSQGGSPTPQYSTGTVTQSQMSTGLQGGAVFKPFSGKGTLTLDNLLM